MMRQVPKLAQMLTWHHCYKKNALAIQKNQTDRHFPRWPPLALGKVIFGPKIGSSGLISSMIQIGVGHGGSIPFS